MGKKNRRPFIITFVSIMDIVAGVILLSAAGLWLPLINWIVSVYPSIAPYIAWIQGLGAVILGIGGGLSILVGYSLLKGKSWAYYLTLVGYGLGLAGILTPVQVGGGIAGTIVSIIMMALLLRRDAQKYCGTKIGWGWG